MVKDLLPRGWNIFNPKIIPNKTTDTIPKPILSPIPIKVQIRVSKPTFMQSLIGQEKQDICVNIFYNGEFTHSNIYRAQTMRSSTADEKQPSFSGRRIDTTLEIPWVVVPFSNTSKGQTGGTNFSARWNTINDLLSKEAAKWDIEEKTTNGRTPMGTYLENLSKLPVPSSFETANMGGGGIGVIDVSYSSQS